MLDGFINMGKSHQGGIAERCYSQISGNRKVAKMLLNWLFKLMGKCVYLLPVFKIRLTVYLHRLMFPCEDDPSATTTLPK